MKRNARNAFNALKKIGAPVLGPELGWGGHFAISGELYGRDNGFYEGHKDEGPNGFYWADYWENTNAGPGEEFGVNKAIVDILDYHGLYTEWYNPGVLSVHDA